MNTLTILASNLFSMFSTLFDMSLNKAFAKSIKLKY